MGQFVKRQASARGSSLNGGQAAAGEFLSAYPALWEYLSLDHWEDGKPRRTATLLVFVEDGRVKLCLSDRDAQRTAWASALNLDMACAALESDLVEDSVEWRKARPVQRRDSK